MGQTDMDLLRFLRKTACPVVETQGTPLLPGAGRVMISNEQVGKVGAEHLLSLGFKHLGFVTFEENAMEVPRRASFSQTVQARQARFHDLSFANLVAQVTICRGRWA